MPYVTPQTTPVSTIDWRVSIPDDEEFFAIFMGALRELEYTWNYEQTSGITIAQTVSLFEEVYASVQKVQNSMIGSLVHYVTINPPDGVLECNGTNHLRVDYPELYAILPPSLIIDADNFITPTLQEIFLLGAGATILPEDTGGASDVVLDITEMPPHDHTYNFPNIAIDIKSVGAPNLESASNPPIPLQTTQAGGGQAHENMPPYVAYKIGLVAE